MQLTKRQIDRYRSIYQKQYRVVLPEKDAIRQANALLSLMRMMKRTNEQTKQTDSTRQ